MGQTRKLRPRLVEFVLVIVVTHVERLTTGARIREHLRYLVRVPPYFVEHAARHGVVDFSRESIPAQLLQPTGDGRLDARLSLLDVLLRGLSKPAHLLLVIRHAPVARALAERRQSRRAARGEAPRRRREQRRFFCSQLGRAVAGDFDREFDIFMHSLAVDRRPFVVVGVRDAVLPAKNFARRLVEGVAGFLIVNDRRLEDVVCELARRRRARARLARAGGSGIRLRHRGQRVEEPSTRTAALRGRAASRRRRTA
mmetsp:Transcript_7255/g.22873  ORF Transcript_7255/g.22873 Transcript_7255/m.22873 type:complete len:255 (-) Transcript_7255:11-775(-)